MTIIDFPLRGAYNPPTFQRIAPMCPTSVGDDCLDSNRSMGTEWFRESRTTPSKQRLHAPRALLRPGLFILQIALVILDPNLVFVSILNWFQLLQYFSAAIIHEGYKGPHLSIMVEESFYALITIVSEEANATKMPLLAQVRREIVHALAMGPCSYTDLTERVAERVAEDACFERVLSETANFKARMYELKDEVYDEVNPFYFHYARNRREEVENVLKARLKKNPNLNPVIVPNRGNAKWVASRTCAPSSRATYYSKSSFTGSTTSWSSRTRRGSHHPRLKPFWIRYHTWSCWPWEQRSVFIFQDLLPGDPSGRDLRIGAPRKVQALQSPSGVDYLAIPLARS